MKRFSFGKLRLADSVHAQAEDAVNNGFTKELKIDAGISDEQLDSIESFYSPLAFMLEHYPSFGDALDWYLELWI